MSKKSYVKKNTNITIGYGSGYVLFDYQISNLEGKMLTFIESLGLKDTQEKATKDIVKDIIYSLYRDTVYITGEAVKKVIEMSSSCGQTTISKKD